MCKGLGISGSPPQTICSIEQKFKSKPLHKKKLALHKTLDKGDDQTKAKTLGMTGRSKSNRANSEKKH